MSRLLQTCFALGLIVFVVPTAPGASAVTDGSLAGVWKGDVDVESSPSLYPLRMYLSEASPDTISGYIVIEWSPAWRDSFEITEGFRVEPDSVYLAHREEAVPSCLIVFQGTQSSDLLSGSFNYRCGHDYFRGVWNVARSQTPVKRSTWGGLKTKWKWLTKQP